MGAAFLLWSRVGMGHPYGMTWRIIWVPPSSFTLCLGEVSSESCAAPVPSDSPDIPTTPWAFGDRGPFRVGPEVVSGIGAAVGFAPAGGPPGFGAVPPYAPRPGEDIEGIPPGAACPCPAMGSLKVALDSGGPIAWMEALSGNSVPPFKTILSKAIPSVDGELP